MSYVADQKSENQSASTPYGDKIGVVVVTYLSAETINQFLDTVDKATSRDLHVVIADNSAEDDSARKAAESRANVTWSSTGGNLGYGRGANHGVAQLSNDHGWIVVVNPDVEWQPGSLDVLLDAAGRWPQAGAFGPLIKDAVGEVYPSARLLPSIGRGIGHAALGKIWPNNPWTKAYRQEKLPPSERETGWLSGSCLLIRREAWDAVSGFDPTYFMYFEDVDLGDRLQRAGWNNVYVPSAVVTHLGGKSTAKVAKPMLKAHHDSAYKYLADRRRGLLWKPVLLVVKLGLVIRLKLETRAEPQPGSATSHN